jgi:(1->4)-alpha-D-glucan 1-alpha-D-glucosylmutase
LAALKGCTTDGVGDPGHLLERRRDGLVKMFVTTRGLQARAEWREAFEHGTYVPLASSGARRDSVFAFARQAGDRAVVTIAPRLIASLVPDTPAPPIGRGVWGDTRISLAAIAGSMHRFREAFTGAAVQPEMVDGVATLSIATVLERFPVAVLLPA